MLYGHASIAVACPYRRTMFEGILVLSLSTLYDHLGMSEVTPCGRPTVRKRGVLFQRALDDSVSNHYICRIINNL